MEGLFSFFRAMKGGTLRSLWITLLLFRSSRRVLSPGSPPPPTEAVWID